MYCSREEDWDLYILHFYRWYKITFYILKNYFLFCICFYRFSMIIGKCCHIWWFILIWWIFFPLSLRLDIANWRQLSFVHRQHYSNNRRELRVMLLWKRINLHLIVTDSSQMSPFYTPWKHILAIKQFFRLMLTLFGMSFLLIWLLKKYICRERQREIAIIMLKALKLVSAIFYQNFISH